MEWTSIKQAFEKLNESEEYVILRNYECLGQEQLLDEHLDIDLLCRNRERVKEILNCKPRMGKDDGIHFYISVKGIKIPVDIRTLNDGYYDAKWEEALLQNRQKNEDGFWVVTKETYFYSLLYHALVQKEKLSADYETRITEMAKELSIPFEKPYEKLLDRFMSEQGYHYTYPGYLKAVVNLKNIDKSLVEKNFYKKTRHNVYIGFRNLYRKIRRK